jgi:hypothetical protein
MGSRHIIAILAWLTLAALSCDRIEATREEAAPRAAKPTLASTRPAHEWPPRVGEPYPDLALLTPGGERMMLSSLRGRVVMVEAIGLDCPACNAFAGANHPGVGGFRGVPTQECVPSMRDLLYHYSVDPDDPRLVHVKLLLYDLSRTRAPSPETARQWSAHYGLEKRPNVVVLVGENYLIGRDTYDLIPGFHLVDLDFRLRWDSSGYDPVHDLWRELLPALPGMLAEVGAPPAPGG